MQWLVLVLNFALEFESKSSLATHACNRASRIITQQPWRCFGKSSLQKSPMRAVFSFLTTSTTVPGVQSSIHVQQNGAKGGCMFQTLLYRMREREAPSYTHKRRRAAQESCFELRKQTWVLLKNKTMYTLHHSVVTKCWALAKETVRGTHTRAHSLKSRLFTKNVLRGRLKPFRKVKITFDASSGPVQKAFVCTANGTALRGHFSTIMLHFQPHCVLCKCRLLVLVVAL